MKAQANGASKDWRSLRIFGMGVGASAVALAMVATACGGTEAGDADSDRGSDGGKGAGNSKIDGGTVGQQQSDADSTTKPAEITCSTIAAGPSKVTINGADRTFNVVLPSSTNKMALLFLWHGWMQDPAKFANEIVYDVPAQKWVPFDPNAFPMPLMIVTPNDTKMIPPWGLDWDIATGTKDFQFFDGMMKCIKEQFTIDTDRIYSFGFSAGAVFTNMLSAQYPHLFAATISESGAWFNDPPEQKEILVPIVQWKWPAFDPADKGNVLLTHGGKEDYATVISLENCAQKAFPFLKQNARTVVDCTHDFGHTLDPDLTQGMYYDWMWSHKLGGPALTGLPTTFPSQGSPVGRTSCQFRGL